MRLVFFLFSFSFSLLLPLTVTNAQECSKEEAKKAVEFVCGLVASKGAAALPEINSYRFCGSNYVWIQEPIKGGKIMMVQHPIKVRLNQSDIAQVKDDNNVFLFVEFDKKVKESKEGWVDYSWTKPGDEKATPKTSFVKMCDEKTKWIAGAGVWK